jgi:hypothetical protein
MASFCRTSIEVDLTDDMAELHVEVIVETDLLVRGYGQPADVEYSGEVVGESAIRFEEEIGTNITHIYEASTFVRNLHESIPMLAGEERRHGDGAQRDGLHQLAV